MLALQTGRVQSDMNPPTFLLHLRSGDDNVIWRTYHDACTSIERENTALKLVVDCIHKLPCYHVNWYFCWWHRHTHIHDDNNYVVNRLKPWSLNKSREYICLTCARPTNQPCALVETCNLNFWYCCLNVPVNTVWLACSKLCWPWYTVCESYLLTPVKKNWLQWCIWREKLECGNY